MPFHAPRSQGPSDPPPAGTFVARCYSMVDLGSHDDSYQGGPVKLRRKVRVTFELPTETKIFREGEVAKPYVIGREFTFSMWETAGLRLFIEEWGGRTFTDDEAYEFDFAKMLGKPCMLSVSHDNKKGRTYANMGSALPLPKGMICPPQVNQKQMFHLEDLGDPATIQTFNSLPEWLQKKIETSKEWIAFMDAQGSDAHVTKFVPPDADADDIPF